MTRDIISADQLASEPDLGTCYVAVIGIDRYEQPTEWRTLDNAVNDAIGVYDAFVMLGFSAARSPLLGSEATHDAIHHMVTTELRWLTRHDSLVLFFAGHGHTTDLDDPEFRAGYIVPYAGAWLQVEHLLENIARLRAGHILVILDSCHSGIALPGTARSSSEHKSIELLEHDRSRLVIASARHGKAADGDGPLPGHSRFTGHLLLALRDRAAPGAAIPATELAHLVAKRVNLASGGAQLADFEPFKLDAGGDLIIRVADAGMSVHDEIEAYLREAQATENERVADGCRKELEGHNEGWRSVEAVKWGEAPNSRPLAGPYPDDPRLLSAAEFDELATAMRKSRSSIRWPLARLEAMAADAGDGVDILASEQSPSLFYPRSSLRSLLVEIRDRVRALARPTDHP